MLPALRFIRHPRDAFREVRPPEGWARLEPLGWVSLFLGVHTSLLYSQLLSVPHLLPALLGALALLAAHSLVFWGALRGLGAKASLGDVVWAAPLTLLPAVAFLLLAYVPVQVLGPDLFYDYFFFEDLRYAPGVSTLLLVLWGTVHLARRAAEGAFGLPRNRAIGVGAFVAAYYVVLGLLLYGFTSGDLLFVI